MATYISKKSSTYTTLGTYSAGFSGGSSTVGWWGNVTYTISGYFTSLTQNTRTYNGKIKVDYRVGLKYSKSSGGTIMMRCAVPSHTIVVGGTTVTIPAIDTYLRSVSCTSSWDNPLIISGTLNISPSNISQVLAAPYSQIALSLNAVKTTFEIRTSSTQKFTPTLSLTDNGVYWSRNTTFTVSPTALTYAAGDPDLEPDKTVTLTMSKDLSVYYQELLGGWSTSSMSVIVPKTNGTISYSFPISTLTSTMANKQSAVYYFKLRTYINGTYSDYGTWGTPRTVALSVDPIYGPTLATVDSITDTVGSFTKDGNTIYLIGKSKLRIEATGSVNTKSGTSFSSMSSTLTGSTLTSTMIGATQAQYDSSEITVEDPALNITVKDSRGFSKTFPVNIITGKTLLYTDPQPVITEYRRTDDDNAQGTYRVTWTVFDQNDPISTVYAKRDDSQTLSDSIHLTTSPYESTLTTYSGWLGTQGCYLWTTVTDYFNTTPISTESVHVPAKPVGPVPVITMSKDSSGGLGLGIAKVTSTIGLIDINEVTKFSSDLQGGTTNNFGTSAEYFDSINMWDDTNGEVIEIKIKQISSW